MGRTTHPRRRVGEHERDAIGGERTEHGAWPITHEAVELGAVRERLAYPPNGRAVDVARDRSCAGS